jgi:hypothetical protein
VRFTFDIAIAFLVAVATSVASSWWAVERAPLFNALRVGTWVAWPHAGGADADPYDLAAASRSADLPLGSAEGLTFTASSDDQGGSLSGSCTYEVAGTTPPARLWTLTAYDAAGKLMPNPADRFAYDSRAILRRADGSFVITVAPRVQPGNWLPVAAATRFTLVLRLYDTPLTSTARPAAITMPAIRKTACP